MVREQISSREIIDPKVIRAMSKIPREQFVPDKYKHLAYSDQPLPIGENQTISQPYVVAFMTQALQLKRSSRVLEIGTGSGYQTAILASIAKEVYTIEVIKSLIDNARDSLKQLGIKNVRFKHANGRAGWQEFAPFDRIIVTAASEDIPRSLQDQLVDGGLMIIPVGRQYWSQDLVLVTKKKNRLSKENLLPVRFVPLVKKQ